MVEVFWWLTFFYPLRHPQPSSAYMYTQWFAVRWRNRKWKACAGLESGRRWRERKSVWSDRDSPACENVSAYEMRPRDIVRPTPSRVTDCAVQCAKVCYSGGRGCRGEGVCWSGVGEGLRVSPRFCLSPTFAFAYQGSLNQSISASLTPDKKFVFFPTHLSSGEERHTWW